MTPDRPKNAPKSPQHDPIFGPKMVRKWSTNAPIWPQIGSNVAQKRSKKSQKNQNKRLKVIWTFLKVHKNTQNPLRKPPGVPFWYCNALAISKKPTFFFAKSRFSACFFTPPQFHGAICMAIRANIKKNSKQNSKKKSQNIQVFSGFLMSLIFFRFFGFFSSKKFDFFSHHLNFELYRSRGAGPYKVIMIKSKGSKNLEFYSPFFLFFFVLVLMFLVSF